MFDVIVVGSGPAGVFAAYSLRGKNVALLDVGFTASSEARPNRNLYELREEGGHEAELNQSLIGPRFESLVNLGLPTIGAYMSPKLKGPRMRFITEKPEPGEPRISPDGFDPVMSFAKGGLANAWGAGVMRFTDRDLSGYPIAAKDLVPFYDEVTRTIGITGTDDDLTPYFGGAAGLQPPLPLSSLSVEFLARYQRSKARLNRKSVFAGRLRSAVLSKKLGDRTPYAFESQDFFFPNIPAVYHPGFTLDEMVKRQEVNYLPGYQVIRFEEMSDRVKVIVRNLKTRTLETFEAAKLVLAAGTLNTSKIVLESRNAVGTKLPILDNPVSFIPVLNPFRIGKRADTRSYPGAELVVVYDGELFPQPVQGSFYGLLGPLRSDLLIEFPLSARGNLAATKYLVPALGMLQLFYPDAPTSENFIQLDSSGVLKIQYRAKKLGALEKHFVRVLRSMGYFSALSLCRFPIAGSSIHYAGSLPMRKEPKNFETHTSGLLSGTRGVYVADAATFPLLPSKNLTMTIMANAMRVGRAILEQRP